MFGKLLVILLVAGTTGATGCARKRDLSYRFNVVWWPKDAIIPPHAEKSAADNISPDPWLKGLEPVPTTPLGVPEYSDSRAIYFDPDQNLIDQAGCRKLKQLLIYLDKYKQANLLIESYCEDTGSEEYNRALSERRALTVSDYLHGRGLAKNRLHTLSFGGKKPPKKENTPKATRRSCRVELTVILPRTPTASP